MLKPVSAFVLVLCVLGSAPAQAQEARPLPVHRGQRVWITTDDGVVHSGRVDAVALDTVKVIDGSRATVVSTADVRRVETTDSLKEGMVQGGVLGGVAGGVFGVVVGGALCEGTCPGYQTAFGLLGAAAGAGVGVLTGAALDALVPGRRIVYYRTTTVSVTPVLARRAKGLAVSIRW